MALGSMATGFAAAAPGKALAAALAGESFALESVGLAEVLAAPPPVFDPGVCGALGELAGRWRYRDLDAPGAEELIELSPHILVAGDPVDIIDLCTGAVLRLAPRRGGEVPGGAGEGARGREIREAVWRAVRCDGLCGLPPQPGLRDWARRAEDGGRRRGPRGKADRVAGAGPASWEVLRRLFTEPVTGQAKVAGVDRHTVRRVRADYRVRFVLGC